MVISQLYSVKHSSNTNENEVDSECRKSSNEENVRGSRNETVSVIEYNFDGVSLPFPKIYTYGQEDTFTYLVMEELHGTL